jgi:hypothetical protein
MVYSSPYQYQDDDQIFFSQGPSLAGQTTNNNKPVKVYYNGSGLDDIGGPVPMVDISRNFNRSEGGILFSTTTKATITGKIMRTDNTSGVNPNGTGTAVILDAAQKMTDLFSQDAGVFQIRCGTTNILEGSGVKINSFNLNKNTDNWIFSADYTIDLEYTSPASGQYIKSASDAWSLEPMDEYIYTSFARNIKQKSEYHNPKLKPTAASDAAKVPTNTIGTTEMPAGTIDLNVFNIPQFKLSRRLTAEGVPSGGSGTAGRNYSAYLNARDWVVKRLGEPFGGTYGAGVSGNGPTFSSSGMTGLSSFTNLFLYNHLRTTNFNELAGTYEVNETWLAMPTGIKYVEDYTIESSTDERFIRTVRVQGSIKGLMIAQLPIMTGASGVIPDKSGIIDLSYSKAGGLSGTGMNQNVMDLSTSVSASSAETRYFDNKYQNALSGWINDVKPYLYRRASSAIDLDSSSDDYIPSTISPQPGAKNPIYSKQKLLNIIPISTNEGHDPRKGTISYSYEFNDKFRFISGVLAESISINQTGPVDVINEAFVLGRRLGPVLQSLGAKTSAKKDLTFEVIVVPPSSWKGFMLSNAECPLYTGGNTYQTIQTIIEGFKPFGDRKSSVFGTFTRLNDTGQVYVSQDNANWNPTEGRYTRTIGWIYQTCNLSRSYLDD